MYAHDLTQLPHPNASYFLERTSFECRALWCSFNANSQNGGYGCGDIRIEHL